MFKQQKGITLIALVITIIVLLILAGVTIAMLSGNDSAPQKAQAAAADTKVAEAKEQAALDVVAKYTDYMEAKYQNNTLASTVTSFTAYLGTLSGNNVLGKGHESFYTVSGTTITIVPPPSSGTTAVTGTITDGGSINW